ncbi:MAG: hypothetical protein KA113_15030 [Syntrophaceae bacterium]|nr:hypothetical protein [Syntrophaceae bacterium]
MLRELNHIKQHKGEPKRKWYESEYFDLIVWFSESHRIIRFQLCYDKNKNEKALTWKVPHEYSHNRVDDGEHGTGAYKSSPVLKADGHFNKDEIAERFIKESGELKKEIIEFVYKKILEYKNI